PPFSRVRVSRYTVLTLLMVSVAPGGTSVRPLPAMPPPDQVIELPAVTSMVPSSVPPVRFNTAGATVPVPLNVAVPLGMFRVLLVQMTLPINASLPMLIVTRPLMLNRPFSEMLLPLAMKLPAPVMLELAPPVNVFPPRLNVVLAGTVMVPLFRPPLNARPPLWRSTEP